MLSSPPVCWRPTQDVSGDGGLDVLAAGHTAGETGPVLAGIQSRSLQAVSITDVPGQAFSVTRSWTKEV